MATPYRLCLCQLARVVASPQLLWGPAEAPELYSLPRLRLALALLTELLQGGEAQERSLAQLLDRLRDALGARDGGAAGQLLCLWLAGEQLDLVSLGEELGRLVRHGGGVEAAHLLATRADEGAAWQEAGLGGSSVLGLFVRQCALELGGLSFSAAAALASRCRQYAAAPHALRAAAPAALQPPPASEAAWLAALRPVLHAFPEAPAPPQPLRPTATAAARLAAAGEALSSRAEGAADARALLRSLQPSLQPHPAAPPPPELLAAAAGLRLAAAAASHDGEAAVESLHALSQLASAAAGPGGGAEAPAGGGGGARGAGAAAAAGGGWLCAALAPGVGAQLSLGALHLQEGHLEAALSCLSEALRSAQEAGDAAALAQAVGLAASLVARQAPGGPRAPPPRPAHPAAAAPTRAAAAQRALLRRCGAMAEELRRPELGCFAAAAASQLSVAASAPDAAAVAADAQRRMRALAYEARAAVPFAPPAPCARQQQPPPGEPHLFAATAAGVLLEAPSAAAVASACRAAASQGLTLGAAWAARGCPALAAAQARSFLVVHGAVCGLDEFALAHCQLAALAQARDGPEAGARQLRAAYGRLQPAQQPGGPARHCPPQLRSAAVALAHGAALARGELRTADRLLSLWRALLPPPAAGQPALRLHYALAGAEAARAAGRLGCAATQAAEVADEAAALGLPSLRARALLLQAACAADAGCRAGLAAAREAAEGARVLAARCRLDPIRAEATCVLLELALVGWGGVGKAGAAAAEAAGAAARLRSATPFLAGSAPLLLRGRALLALGRYTVLEALAECSEGDAPPAARGPLGRAAQTLRQAATAFEKAHCAAQAAEALRAAAAAWAAAGREAEAREAEREAEAAERGAPAFDLMGSFGLE